MSRENFYAEKIFKMVESGMNLVTPWGMLDSADKDFLSFIILYMTIKFSVN
ncbi:hypothetical protein KAW08_01215 [bacterium]|nr:hypothetical protein [bacterium]